MINEPLRYVMHNGLEFALCPMCGERTDAEYVDIGVGNERCEPWSCHACGWIEPVLDDELCLVRVPF